MSRRCLWRLAILLVLCAELALCSAQRDASKRSGSVESDLTSRYFTNNEMKDFMRSFTESSKCGNISRMFSVGKSVEGVDLLVLEVGLNPGVVEAKPNFKFVANMHGDEPSGRQLLLKLAEWLCENWKKDPRAKAIVEGAHLFLMPSMNPDGFAKLTRNNAQRIDLNRNFPDRFEVNGSILHPLGGEAPETLALMKWIEEGFFVGSGNLHEGALVANYPWDADELGTTAYAACPDDDAFVYLAKTYAKSHQLMHKSKKFTGGITNGNAWYTVYGSMQDFNYIMGNCMELTLELNNEKNPPARELALLWEDNKNAFLNFIIVTCFRSFRGTVVDEKGQPLVATIKVKGIKKDYKTRPEIGDFYRPLSPGKYRVTVSADGYQSFQTTVFIPRSRPSRVYHIQLSNAFSASQFRTIQISSGGVYQGSQSWTLFHGFAALSAVFLVIGIYQVRKMSTVRRTE